jgi:hypothetical protein
MQHGQPKQLSSELVVVFGEGLEVETGINETNRMREDNLKYNSIINSFDNI